MKLKRAQELLQKLQEAGVRCDLREAYVGRAMSQATVAITTRDGASTAIALSVCPSLKRTRRDSMGLGVVFY